MRKEENEISERINEIKTILEELDKISLKPVNYYKSEILQLMINEEEAQKKIGWQKRIEELKIMKEIKKQLDILKKVDDITELIPSFNDVISELKRI